MQSKAEELKNAQHQCRNCGHLKQPSEFNNTQLLRVQSGNQGWCKLCLMKKNIAQQYGLNFEVYEEIMKEQDYSCGICRAKFSSSNKPNVDHDHETNQVRGILCSQCNLGLGKFKDCPMSLLNAVQYLLRRECDDDFYLKFYDSFSLLFEEFGQPLFPASSPQTPKAKIVDIAQDPITTKVNSGTK